MLNVNHLFDALETLIDRGKEFQAAQVLARVILRYDSRLLINHKRYVKITRNRALSQVILKDPLFDAWLAVFRAQQKLARAKNVEDLEYRIMVRKAMP